MKTALLISGIIEILGGLICYMYPELVFVSGTAYLYRLYAISALVLGIINILMYNYYDNSKFFRLAYLAMMFFHGAVAMISNSSDPTHMTQQTGATGTHLFLFALMTLMYLKEIKPDNPSKQ